MYGSKRPQKSAKYSVYKGRGTAAAQLHRDALLIGMRHGTEALVVSSHVQGDKRYFRIWVNGKTWVRWLITKYAGMDVLERLHTRQKSLSSQSLEMTL